MRDVRPATPEDPQRVRRTLLVESALAGIGCLLMYFGARTSGVLVVAGVVLVGLAAVLGGSVLIRARRPPRRGP